VGAFPFRKDFEPVVQIGENVRLIGVGANYKFYKVKHIEPVQPFIVDFAGSDFYDSAIPAHGVSGYNTKNYKMNTEFALWEGMLGQFRIELLDDIVLVISHVGAGNQLYTLKYTETYLQKEKPRHTVFERTTSTDTESLLWTVTNVSETGRRKAKIKKVWITNESASGGEVRFGDGDGTGNDANSANADMSFRVGAHESVGFHEEEIPEVEFLTGITWQASVQPVRVTVTLEEDLVNPFEKKHSNEIFVFEDHVPYMRCINPLAVSQTTARILVAGFKYALEEIKRPEHWTDIPVSRMPAPE